MKSDTPKRKVDKDKAITYGQITVCVLFVIAIAIGAIMNCGCVASNDFYGLKLHNNIFARDVSSEELMVFLEQDPTNEHEVAEYRHKDCFVGTLPTDIERVGIYDESKSVMLSTETLHDYITSGYMCVNFAVDLHNNSEKAGIRCAVVEIMNQGHVLNAYNTTDKGLIYVDASTGSDSLSYYDTNLGETVIPNGKVRDGVGTSFTELLGDTNLFKLTW